MTIAKFVNLVMSLSNYAKHSLTKTNSSPKNLFKPPLSDGCLILRVNENLQKIKRLKSPKSHLGICCYNHIKPRIDTPMRLQSRWQLSLAKSQLSSYLLFDMTRTHNDGIRRCGNWHHKCTRCTNTDNHNQNFRRQPKLNANWCKQWHK